MGSVLVCAGCHDSERAARPGGSTPDFPTDGAALEILREQAGTFSSLTRPVKWVIHDERGLAWAPAEIGRVDFAREMVLVVGTGPTPSADYSVRLKRVYRSGPILKAEIEYLYPPHDVPLSTISASPYHIVVTPRSDLNVEGFTAPSVVGTQRHPPPRRIR